MQSGKPTNGVTGKKLDLLNKLDDSFTLTWDARYTQDYRFTVERVTLFIKLKMGIALARRWVHG